MASQKSVKERRTRLNLCKRRNRSNQSNQSRRTDLLDEVLEKRCCYCEYATAIRETTGYICNKKGVVPYNFSCRKFVFDPLKLSPILPAKPLQFSLEDFQL